MLTGKMFGSMQTFSTVKLFYLLFGFISFIGQPHFSFLYQIQLIPSAILFFVSMLATVCCEYCMWCGICMHRRQSNILCLYKRFAQNANKILFYLDIQFINSSKKKHLIFLSVCEQQSIYLKKKSIDTKINFQSKKF